MKLTAFLLLLIALPALAADNLIYQPGVKVTVLRTLSFGGKTLDGVQVISWTSTTALLATKKGPAQVPFSSLPTMWKSSLAKVRPPVKLSSAETNWEAERIRYETSLLHSLAANAPKKADEANSSIYRAMEIWDRQHPLPLDVPAGPDYSDTSVPKLKAYAKAQSSARAVISDQTAKLYSGDPDQQAGKILSMMRLWDTLYPAPRAE